MYIQCHREVFSANLFPYKFLIDANKIIMFRSLMLYVFLLQSEFVFKDKFLNDGAL